MYNYTINELEKFNIPEVQQALFFGHTLKEIKEDNPDKIIKTWVDLSKFEFKPVEDIPQTKLIKDEDLALLDTKIIEEKARMDDALKVIIESDFTNLPPKYAISNIKQMNFNNNNYTLNVSRPKPTRWNRKYTEVAQFYYTWESQWGVMNIALNEYDCKFMLKDVPIPTL